MLMNILYLMSDAILCFDISNYVLKLYLVKVYVFSKILKYFEKIFNKLLLFIHSPNICTRKYRICDYSYVIHK